MRSLTRLGIVVETIAKLARELARFRPALRYGSADNMTLADERSIDLTAPARTAKGGSSGSLILENFSLDEAGLVLECPNGVAPVSTSAATAKLQARFDLARCRECPDRA